MDLLTSIFDALMRMTPHKTDTESRAQRADRMHLVAASIKRRDKKSLLFCSPT